MHNLIKVIAFSLTVIGGFWGFANYGIPQIKPALPPVEENIDLDAMTMEQFVAYGNKVFLGKGNCTLCHNALGRAPALDKIGKVAIERLSDPLYRGTAKSIKDYLLESLTKPSAFVVPGFGKSGSVNAESPMPDVTGPGIGLNEAELLAVIAYLQDASGTEITVSIPVIAAKAEEVFPTEIITSPKTAEEIINKYSCGSCHTVADQTGEVGPNLTKIGVKRNKAYLRQAILDPEAVIAKGFTGGVMPGIYGEEMKANELEMIVNYLAGLK